MHLAFVFSGCWPKTPFSVFPSVLKGKVFPTLGCAAEEEFNVALQHDFDMMLKIVWLLNSNESVVSSDQTCGATVTWEGSSLVKLCRSPFVIVAEMQQTEGWRFFLQHCLSHMQILLKQCVAVGILDVLFQRGLLDPTIKYTKKVRIVDGITDPKMSLELILGGCEDFQNEFSAMSELMTLLGHNVDQTRRKHPRKSRTRHRIQLG
jgi:hypothetical protein